MCVQSRIGIQQNAGQAMTTREAAEAVARFAFEMRFEADMERRGRVTLAAYRPRNFVSTHERNEL